MGISFTMPEPGHSLQRDKRDWSDDFTDQHGRRFESQYDIGNNRPIGELKPVGFDPPWLPPMYYIRWARAKGGFHFRWDYDALANDLVESSVAYYAGVMDFMLEHMKEYVEEHGIPELGDAVPSMVLRSPLGHPPLSPAIVLACQAGEPWALGVKGAPVNEDLKRALLQSTTGSGRAALLAVRDRMTKMVGEYGVKEIVQETDVIKPPKTIKDEEPLDMSEVTYQQFFASCKSRGTMKMDEIVTAWREHKAKLAAEKAQTAEVAA